MSAPMTATVSAPASLETIAPGVADDERAPVVGQEALKSSPVHFDISTDDPDTVTSVLLSLDETYQCYEDPPADDTDLVATMKKCLDQLNSDDSGLTGFLSNEFSKIGLKLHIHRATYEIENQKKVIPRYWVSNYSAIMGEKACHFKMMQPLVANFLGLPPENSHLALHKH